MLRSRQMYSWLATSSMSKVLGQRLGQWLGMHLQGPAPQTSLPTVQTAIRMGSKKRGVDGMRGAWSKQQLAPGLSPLARGGDGIFPRSIIRPEA